MSSAALASREFERAAGEAVSARYGKALAPARVAGVPKTFDFVSADGRVVGDAKYYAMVQGGKIPSAKFGAIAEYVWLLQKADADERFLVFGNDRRVPNEWLRRYGKLARETQFYFLDLDGNLSDLREAPQ